MNTSVPAQKARYKYEEDVANCPTPIKRIELGTFGHCQSIELSLTADYTGMFRAEWQDQRGSMIQKQFPTLEDNRLVIKCKWFNERSNNEIKLYDPAGNTLSVESEPDVFVDVFALSVRPMFDAPANPIQIQKLICGTEECVGLALVSVQNEE